MKATARPKPQARPQIQSKNEKSGAGKQLVVVDQARKLTPATAARIRKEVDRMLAKE